ncbi:MAG: hypothetical protein J6V80_03840 [Clostridia bacterium]|nr:hypothetical protein [Clostridia bacterium]
MATRKPAQENNRVKLLIGIINKEDEQRFTEIVNECATAVHFSGVGHGTARSAYMNYFGLGEVEKRMTLSLIPATAEHNILNAIGHGLKLYLVGRGIAFTTPLSGISNIINDAILSGVDKPDRPTGRRAPISKKKEKQTMHELVIAVVNTKYTDIAIDAARAAGATGATVFHTKSISNDRAEQSIGTSISRETDSILLLTTLEYKTKIMEAVRDAAGLKTEGGAIIFSLPVDDLVGVGRFEDYVDGEENL